MSTKETDNFKILLKKLFRVLTHFSHETFELYNQDFCQHYVSMIQKKLTVSKIYFKKLFRILTHFSHETFELYNQDFWQRYVSVIQKKLTVSKIYFKKLFRILTHFSHETFELYNQDFWQHYVSVIQKKLTVSKIYLKNYLGYWHIFVKKHLNSIIKTFGSIMFQWWTEYKPLELSLRHFVSSNYN